MHAAGKWALAIVPAGTMLGALLGNAANPEMKDPPAPWWQLTGRDEIVADDAQFAEAWPEDLDVFGGYRPDLDYDAEVWALPIPEHDLAALAEQPFRVPAYELPRVTYGVTAAHEVADEAEAVAEQAQAAEAAEPAPPPAPAPAEVRKPELAIAGLY
jgi:hypothetical protein